MEKTTPTIPNEELEKLYLQSLSEKETKAFKIASEHLGMSYQTDKSIGFIAWRKLNYPTN
jgi:hypothetical protein